MPLITYRPKVFNREHLKIIGYANQLLKRYVELGVPVTGRTIYYRFIAMDLLPETWIDEAYNRKHGLPDRTKNTLKNYKRLMEVFNAARLAGVMDWDYLRDTLRDVEQPNHWQSPSHIIRAVADQYRIDKWEDQPRRVEVWAEKDAVEGLLAAVCPRLDVPHFVCRGQPSQTAMWHAGQRMRQYLNEGKEPVVLYLGDHDPTGIDITRDITARLEMFARREIEVVRIALNMDQVREYGAPPNPAKTTDSRYKKYAEEHGEDSWELDALEPEVMLELIRSSIMEYREDEDAYARLEAQERRERALLSATSVNWEDVAQWVEETYEVEPEDEDEG